MKVRLRNYPSETQLEWDKKENEGSRWFIMMLNSSTEAMREVSEMFK